MSLHRLRNCLKRLYFPARKRFTEFTVMLKNQDHFLSKNMVLGPGPTLFHDVNTKKDRR